MKKVTCLLLLLLIGTACFSQTAKELENELRVIRMRNGETSTGKKDVAIKLLGMDTFNEAAIDYLIHVYSTYNQKDSINYLFNRLIRENPKSPEPYVLMVQLLSTTPDQRIGYYEEAYKRDSLHPIVNYELGKKDYNLFINGFTETQNKENRDNNARSAIKHFSTLCNQDSSYRELLSYPLVQLATYLGDADLKKRFEQFNVQLYHFPVSAFINLPTDWQTDYTVDVMRMHDIRWRNALSEIEPEKMVVGVEYAKFHIEWYSRALRTLKEPVLKTLEAENVYRLTCLFSDDLQTVVGLVNTNHSIYVYWKQSDRSGKPIDEHTKTLTQKEWNAIDSAFHSIDFWNMPSIKVDLSHITLDGIQCIMEGKASGNYHVVDRKTNDDFISIFNQLFKLADSNISIRVERH